MVHAFTRRARTSHAFRVATGATALATLGLVAPFFTSCISQLFFLIATVAGTAENTQGFQLRSASLSLFGAALGALCYAIIATIAHTSTVTAFFLALPPLATFSLLRADPALAPAPALANVVVGLLLITHADTGRSAVAPVLRSTLLDALQAWFFAVAVNLVFPARAADEARLQFAAVLRRLGAAFSAVATTAFPQPVAQNPLSRPPPLSPLNSSFSSSSSLNYVALALSDPVPKPTVLPPQLAALEHSPLERSKAMLETTAASLAFFTTLPPFGRTRTEDHAILARTRTLVAAARHEPRVPWPTSGTSVSTWRKAEKLASLQTALLVLVNRAASLESVTLRSSTPTGILTQPDPRPPLGAPALFSPKSLARLVGATYVPLWFTHLAVCAAACASVSADLQEWRTVAVHPPHPHFDAVRWRMRRKEMYIGYLLTRRLNWRKKGDSACIGKAEQRDMETPGVRGLDLEFNVHYRAVLQHPHRARRAGPDGEENKDPRSTEQCVAQRQVMSYLLVTCQSASEAVMRVQDAVQAFRSSGDGKTYDSDVVVLPLLPGATACAPVIVRLGAMLRGQARMWEVRFALTHFLLLALTLAFALFLPLGSQFRAGEVAWSYTSAALAAQLSVEPTVFIGVLRVGATALGCVVGLAVSEIVGALARTGLGDGALFARLPILYGVCLLTLLVVPPRLRYMGFLVLVTTNLILFCPRAVGPNCPANSEENVLRAACLPSWELALSRAGNVSVGVVLALVCHVLMWPRFAGEFALRCLLTALRHAARQTHQLRLRYFDMQKQANQFGASVGDGEDAGQKVGIRHYWYDKTDDSGNDNDDDDEGEVSGELYPRDAAVEAMLHEQVGKHVENAGALIRGEAGVWQRGPLAARSLLRSILDDMVALSVSVRELGGVQERRAIFDAEYGGDVFRTLVEPLLRVYDTLQMSVNNVVAATAAVAVQAAADRRELEELLDVLRAAVAHVARCRGELRGEARRRAGRLKVARTFRGDVRKRLARWAAGKNSEGGGDGGCVGVGVGVGVDRERARDDLDVGVAGVRQGGETLEADEVMLYDAMTMALDGCVSAFVRVALSVLDDGDARLRRARRRRGGGGGRRAYTRWISQRINSRITRNS